MTHYSFPSIDQFSHVRRNVLWKAQYRGQDPNDEPIMDRTALMPTLSYEGTVKLHGTNAGVVFENGGITYCQSRENIITPEKDNAGFAKWFCALSQEDLDVIRSNFPADWQKVAVYGEWAGQGIQKNVAISALPKAFYIFAAKTIIENDDEGEWLNVRNWKLPQGIYNIYNFQTFKIYINFESPEPSVAEINKWVLDVEAECPVGKAFDVSDIGEGIVFRCTAKEWESSRYWFKAKGDKHSNSKVRKLATVDIQKYETEQSFISAVLDEGRLEQAFNWLSENNKPQDQTSIGDFIRWIFNDVIKECSPEMQASNIQEKDLGKLLAGPAKKWFFNRIKT
jgi:hypothetical protein